MRPIRALKTICVRTNAAFHLLQQAMQSKCVKFGERNENGPPHENLCSKRARQGFSVVERERTY